MSNITSVTVKIQYSWSLSNQRRRLLDKISRNSTTVFCSEIGIFIWETKRARSLHEHTGTFRLLRVVQERVLVVVEASDHCNHKQYQDDHAPVHPVDEDEEQKGGTTYPPEFPEQECQESSEGLSGTEPHVTVRWKQRGWHC